ncbi:unnamed protein product, partial [Didymodactylos carnosus]
LYFFWIALCTYQHCEERIRKQMKLSQQGDEENNEGNYIVIFFTQAEEQDEDIKSTSSRSELNYNRQQDNRSQQPSSRNQWPSLIHQKPIEDRQNKNNKLPQSN